jgi:hypothetical protein
MPPAAPRSVPRVRVLPAPMPPACRRSAVHAVCIRVFRATPYPPSASIEAQYLLPVEAESSPDRTSGVDAAGCIALRPADARPPRADAADVPSQGSPRGVYPRFPHDPLPAIRVHRSAVSTSRRSGELSRSHIRCRCRQLHRATSGGFASSRNESLRRAVARQPTRCVSAFPATHLIRHRRTADGGRLHLMRVFCRRLRPVRIPNGGCPCPISVHASPYPRSRTRRCRGRRTPPGRRVREGGLCDFPAANSFAPAGGTAPAPPLDQ